MNAKKRHSLLKWGIALKIKMERSRYSSAAMTRDGKKRKFRFVSDVQNTSDAWQDGICSDLSNKKKGKWSAER